MGEVKDQVTPKSTKGKSWLGKFSGKKEDSKQLVETFVDGLAEASEKLDKLINVKESDLAKETGKEIENRKKLSALQSARYHLDAVGENLANYGQ